MSCTPDGGAEPSSHCDSSELAHITCLQQSLYPPHPSLGEVFFVFSFYEVIKACFKRRTCHVPYPMEMAKVAVFCFK